MIEDKARNDTSKILASEHRLNDDKFTVYKISVNVITLEVYELPDIIGKLIFI